MDIADRVMWTYADEQGIVPMDGLCEIPQHVRDDISQWMRRQATPCPHSVALALSGIVFRVVGLKDAWCAACAVESGIEALRRTCARCTSAVDESGRGILFTLAGHAFVSGAWCAACWNEGENE